MSRLLAHFTFLILSCTVVYGPTLIGCSSQSTTAVANNSELTQLPDSNCSFSFGRSNADIQYTYFYPHDSTDFKIEDWSRTQFDSLLKHYRQACTGTSSTNPFNSDSLFGSWNSIQAEIHQAFDAGEESKTLVIMHGDDSYMIIGY